METHDLTGTPVLVHPELAFDPAYRQNEIGTIISIKPVNEDVLVDFGNSSPALYGPDALLVLKDAECLFQLLEDIKVLSERTRRLVYGIATILHHRYEDSFLMSLKICRQDPGIRELVTESLQDVLDRRQNVEVSR